MHSRIPQRPQKTRAPRVGRPQGRFTQHRRIDRLRELLENEPRGLTLHDLASTLRMTVRSVRRYLQELEGVTELESIATSPGGAHVWRIKPSERGRAVSLRRAQAYAILATRRSFDVLKGSALYDELDLALSHIQKIARIPFRAQGKGEISGERNLDARFFVLPPTSRSYAARGEDLDELFRAVADLRVVRFRPRTRPGAPRAERATFHPYALVIHRGSIVVLGVYGGSRELAVEPFEAMADIRASETEHFELPETFDVSEYVHGEFGVGRAERGRVIVEFDARVADEIRARKLHPQQKLATSSDGRVRVQVPLVNVDALVAWILSYGDAARVVEPPELARQVGTVLERAASRYR